MRRPSVRRTVVQEAANSSPISSKTFLLPRETASLARSSASKGVWSSPTIRPSRLLGSSSPRRSSQRQSDCTGCRTRTAAEMYPQQRLVSSPRIVLPACLEAQVANVHQFAPIPVRRAIAGASRQ